MEHINLLTRNIFVSAFFVAWIMGAVLAKGFWLTTLSIFFPLYAWYLVVERVMIMTGFGM